MVNMEMTKADNRTPGEYHFHPNILLARCLSTQTEHKGLLPIPPKDSNPSSSSNQTNFHHHIFSEPNHRPETRPPTTGISRSQAQLSHLFLELHRSLQYSADIGDVHPPFCRSTSFRLTDFGPRRKPEYYIRGALHRILPSNP